ncbi:MULTISPECIES: hypothetical protein [Pyrococcus]|uniref:hypothetical protein n=1 Tax=Pyrococcus TaxID=2260 RepID=UPI001CB779C9|nr:MULTISPECIES: hypothetical protein [Pyrococcus]
MIKIQREDNKPIEEVEKLKEIGTLALLLVLVFGMMVSGCVGGGNIAETASSIIESYTNTESTPKETSSEIPTETATETSEYASWSNPWDSSKPIKVGNDLYLISYIKYKYRVRTEEGGPIYEYEIEKSRGKTKIHVYGTKIDMETGKSEKVDIGEFEVYEYYGKITPISGKEMNETFEYRLWVLKNDEDVDSMFLFPSLDFFTLYASLYGGGENTVGLWIKYGDTVIELYNPGAVGEMGVTPYSEGDFNLLNKLSDIEAIYLGWVNFYTFGFWNILEERDIYTNTKGSEGILGYQYNYEINPDGKITLGGLKFRVSNIKWTYQVQGVTGQGEATIAANLPIPIESKGVFIAQGVNVFTHVKIEDIKFEKL